MERETTRLSSIDFAALGDVAANLYARFGYFFQSFADALSGIFGVRNKKGGGKILQLALCGSNAF